MCRMPVDNTSVVHTAWDIGVGDPTAIWFFRLVGQEIHLVDYYESTGQGFGGYARVLEDKRRENDWIYGRHFAPHDIEARELSTASPRLEAARAMGIDFDVLPKMKIEDGIEYARQIFPRCWFDEDKCEAGLKALAEYRYKRSESVSTDERPVAVDFKPPVKNI